MQAGSSQVGRETRRLETTCVASELLPFQYSDPILLGEARGSEGGGLVRDVSSAAHLAWGRGVGWKGL